MYLFLIVVIEPIENWKFKVLAKRRSKEISPVTLEFDQRGIHVSGEKVESAEIAWSRITNAKTRRNAIILAGTGMVPLYVPRSGFRNRRDFREVSDLVDQKINQSRTVDYVARNSPWE